MFLIISFITLVNALLVISSVNPINSVLSLIGVFLSISTIFIMLNLEFLGFMFIIIYVGAIAVLFLFIVMMINIRKIEKNNSSYVAIGIVLLIIFLIQIGVVMTYKNFQYISNNSYYNYTYNNRADETSRLLLLRDYGFVLFYNRPILVIFAGNILFVSMIASIYLTNTRKGFSTRRQANQLSRFAGIINVLII